VGFALGRLVKASTSKGDTLEGSDYEEIEAAGSQRSYQAGVVEGSDTGADYSSAPGRTRS
jgi:hypothetical protein